MKVQSNFDFYTSKVLRSKGGGGGGEEGSDHDHDTSRFVKTLLGYTLVFKAHGWWRALDPNSLYMLTQ